MVKGTPNFDFDFGAGSFILNARDPTTITKGIVLPTIYLMMRDSCDVYDAINDGVVITVTADAGNGLTGELTQIMEKGKVTFGNLQFSTPGTAKLTFTAGAGNLPVAGKTHTTGTITITFDLRAQHQRAVLA